MIWVAHPGTVPCHAVCSTVNTLGQLRTYMTGTPAQVADLTVALCSVTPILWSCNSTITRLAIFHTRKLNFHLQTSLFPVGRARMKSKSDWIIRTITNITKP